MFAHRGHRGVPTDTELACDLSDAVRVFTDPAADLDPSSARQRRPRSIWSCCSVHVAVAHNGSDAAPDPLRPHQPHRPARDRQIPHLDAAAAMTDRPHPTRPTAHPIRGRLDRQPPLAGLHHVRAHDEAGHVEQRGRAFTTVTNHQGSPSRAALDSSKSGEAPGLVRGPTNPARSRHDPNVHREEPVIGSAASAGQAAQGRRLAHLHSKASESRSPASTPPVDGPGPVRPLWRHLTTRCNPQHRLSALQQV